MCNQRFPGFSCDTCKQVHYRCTRSVYRGPERYIEEARSLQKIAVAPLKTGAFVGVRQKDGLWLAHEAYTRLEVAHSGWVHVELVDGVPRLVEVVDGVPRLVETAVKG